jgi:hypothetical protein
MMPSLAETIATASWHSQHRSVMIAVIASSSSIGPYHENEYRYEKEEWEWHGIA